jgi:hypothetical protein
MAWNKGYKIKSHHASNGFFDTKDFREHIVINNSDIIPLVGLALSIKMELLKEHQNNCTMGTR